jgi:hypothetical protein
MPLQVATYSQAVNLDYVYFGLFYAINDHVTQEEYQKLWDEYFAGEHGGRRKFLRLMKVVKDIILATGLFSEDEPTKEPADEEGGAEKKPPA